MTETARALGAEEVIELIRSHIAACLDGGPNRKAEDIELGRRAGLKSEMISALWDDAENQVQVSLTPIEVVVLPAQAETGKAEALTVLKALEEPETLTALKAKEEERPAASMWRRPVPPDPEMVTKKAEAHLFLPSIQPEVGDEQKHKSEPKPKPDGEANPLARSPEEWPGVLNPKAPLDNARKFVALRHWCRDENVRSVQFWQGQFWGWNGAQWRVVDDATVRAKVYEFLDKAEREIRRDCLIRFEPDISAVNKTVDALKATANLEPQYEMPGWFGKCPVENTRELVACQNGLLYVPERRLLPHTPRFWSPNVLEFEYNPRVGAPRFEQFLEEVWPGDNEAQQSLKEMIGLCLTDETKYQKAFMFVGPKRGGRGTIGRLIQGLIGRENYIGSTMHSFSEGFGMQSFIGKKVAVFSDARLDGVRRQNLSVIAERLLSITGEDVLDINRKYVGYWSGALTTRVVIFSNELLRFQDDSGALASRFITNRMIQTFWGREDPDLTRKLLAERSGILNMALDALDHLRSRGRLIQPSSGLEMSENLTRLTSDVLAFVEECCVIDCNASVTVDKLFTRWETWCASRKVRHGWGKNQFSEKIRAACPTVTSSRPRKDNPGRLVTFVGIGIVPMQKLVTKGG